MAIQKFQELNSGLGGSQPIRSGRREHQAEMGQVRARGPGTASLRLEGDGMKRARVVGLLHYGRHCQLRGVGETPSRKARHPHRDQPVPADSHRRSANASICQCATLRALKLCY